MNLKQMLQESAERLIYPDRWTPISARMHADEQPTDVVMGFGVLNAYTLSLTVSASARCNSVQWNHNVRNLMVKRLFSELFGETEMHIRRAITAVYAQDADEALEALNDALETMKP